MKKILLFILLIISFGCKTKTVYVDRPVVEYKYLDKEIRDSIYIHDSIKIETKGDTVYNTQYKLIYKDKFVHDTLIEKDTVTVVNTIEKPVEVKVIPSWCKFLNILGIISLAIFIAFLARKFK